MRRQQQYSAPMLLGYALAEIERLKAMATRITDGHSLVYGGGGGGNGGGNGGNGGQVESLPHVLYGSKHTKSLRVAAGSGLSVDFEEGHVRVDETYYLVAAGNLAGLTDATTNYVFVNNSGAVTFNTTGFPDNCIPLATVVTVAGAVSTVTDNRAYMWGHHGPAFAGTVTVGVINEYTPDAGVVIEGVKFLDSFLELAEIVKPANPADGYGRVYMKSDDKIYWLAMDGVEHDLTALGGGGAVEAYCFATAVTGAGTISNKTYEPNTAPSNKILTGFESDNDDITLTIEIQATMDAWMPDDVTVSGGGATPVTVQKQNWTQQGDSQVWTAAVNLSDADTSGTLTITLSTGDTATVSYTRSLDPPLMTHLAFKDQGTNPDAYPAIQTQIAQGQTLVAVGTVEAHADEVYIVDFEVTNGEGLQGPFTPAAFAAGVNITAGSGNNATAELKAYCKVTGGSNGPESVSSDFTPGAGESSDVDLNQDVPTFTGGAQGDMTYPGGQEALKDAEQVDVLITHVQAPEAGTTYLYDDNATGELTIPAPTEYVANKLNTARNGGNYRESGVNYRLTATKTTLNGLSATKTATVKIAHIAPVVTVTGATSRLGTDDGDDNYLDHTITLTSSQANLSTHTPVLSLDVGHVTPPTWQGSWIPSGVLFYTRSLRVQDAAIKPGGVAANTWSWASCSIKNRANKEAVVVTTNPDYDLGGFQTRTLNMGPITGGDPPYTHTADIAVPVVDTSKTTVVNTSKGGTPSQVYEANVTEHNDADSSLNNYWTLVAALASEVFDDYTQYFHCSDKKFYESVTAPGGFNVTIAESV